MYSMWLSCRLFDTFFWRTSVACKLGTILGTYILASSANASSACKERAKESDRGVMKVGMEWVVRVQ